MFKFNGKTAALLGGGALGLAAIAGVVHSAAYGGHEHHGFGEGRMFEAVDSNHDGILSKAEISAFVSSRVREFDADNDGQITRAEFDATRNAKREQRQQAMFKRIDANGDGVISAEEFKNARLGPWSKHHDRNGGPERPSTDG